MIPINKCSKAEPKNENCKNYWAYFAPDGYVQVRSIAPTKKLSQQYITFGYSDHNSYEAAGYVLKRVNFSLEVL